MMGDMVTQEDTGEPSAQAHDVLVSRQDSDGICTLVLNRPDKRNAINKPMFTQLMRHIRDLEAGAPEVGVIVICGNGPAFCAGHDLKGSGSNDALGWLRLEILTLEKLTRLPQPVIAQVHGHCYTGGLELALSADLIVAGESAKFADTHGKWGMVPGWGLSQRLPRRVGPSKAMEMMFTCEPWSGRDAERIGLANICVPDEHLDDAVAKLCGSILNTSWHSNAANKRLIYETDGMPLPQGISHEVFRNEGFARDEGQRRKTFS